MDYSPNNSLAKVLVIDADAEMRDHVSGYLRNTGYNTITASDGETGLAMIQAEKPGCVLCDLNLPKLDGINVLRHIADIDAELPIIVMSGQGEMVDVVEALRLGASDFLIKPIVDLEVLEHAIERSLERYSLRQDNIRYRMQLEQANSVLKNNLAMLEQDQQAGLMVQMKMLPVSPMQKGAYVFRHHIVPSLYLSGDFVEHVTVGTDHVVFFVADVSGHGASSAFVTVLLKNLTARMRSDFNHLGNEAILHPAEFLEQANAELMATGIGKHATMFYAVLNTRRNSLVYTVAGHLPLPILIADNDTRYLEGQGAPVGLFEDVEYEETSLELPDEFRLMLFTDGILEVLSEPSLAAKEKHLLTHSPPMRAEPGSVLEHYAVDASQKYPDDIAVLLVDKH
ncbi:MAG: fused response regulator/phosphatase [Gammaproteobacteria bacterium]|nr:fused response regulator/phosphatase [Gammaproteobacteria bacterium]NND39446.1 fused response regulator/phosphatase [Pseudomonadales bacterium]NNL11721.1 fused response regulator/phosphatase [Pseudomonadales bacterium]NNM12259.1 fused response regulator/phosphatase [Pseudomonadales bacterium]